MDSYKVGVKLVMTSNHAPILAALGKELLGINAKVKDLTGGFSKLKFAIGGALGAFAAEKMIGGMVTLINKTKDLSHELTQIQKMGVSDTSGANAAAIAATRSVRGVSQTDALKSWAALFAVSRSEADASAGTAILSTYAKVVANSLGKQLSADDETKTLRTADILGWMSDPKTKQFDLARLTKFLDIDEKLQVATHGQVDVNSLLALAKQGGLSLRGMSEQGLLAMGTLSQYLGGAKSGTAYMSLMQQFAGGTMWTRNAEGLQALGMLGQGEWHKGGGGGIVLSDEASKRLMGMVSGDPMAFVGKLLDYFHANNITGMDDQVRQIFRILPRQTSQRMIGEILMNWGQFQREIAGMKGAPGVVASSNLQDAGDIEQNLTNLSKAYDNFWYAVAGPNKENEIKLLQFLTDSITKVTEAVRGINPDTMVKIAEGIAALAGVVAVGATAALIAAIGPVGWIAAGIAALGLAVAVWGDKVLTYLGPQGQLIYGIVELGKSLMGYDWKSGFANVVSGLQSLWDKLKGIFSGVPNYGPFGSPTSYTGGAHLFPASFEVNGGAAAVGRSVMLGGSSSTGGGAVNVGSLTGNSYIQALRSPFASELADPNKRLQFAAMLLSEDAKNPTAVAESAMNRSAFAHKSLMQMLYSGFYGPINRGLLPSFMRRLRSNPALMARMNAAINAALAGSDLIRGHTDQGMPSDPGGAWEMAHHHLMLGGEVFGDWLRGRGTSQWRQDFEAHAHGGASAAIPPRGGMTIHLNNTTNLDGRVVARNTVSHIVNRGNAVASGGRLTDIGITRPISI